MVGRYAWYEVLDIDPAIATPATIESAYQRAVRQCYPKQQLIQIHAAREAGLRVVVSRMRGA